MDDCIFQKLESDSTFTMDLSRIEFRCFTLRRCSLAIASGSQESKLLLWPHTSAKCWPLSAIPLVIILRCYPGYCSSIYMGGGTGRVQEGFRGELPNRNVVLVVE